MERKLILRNVVCLASVDPSDFDVIGFEKQLDLGEAEERVVVGEFSMDEWEHVRLQIRPERLQLGFKGTADGDLVRRATELFLERVDRLAPDEPIEINAGLRLTLKAGDEDPSNGLVDSDALAGALGGTGGRGGVSLVYRDEQSRWWVELSPLPDEDRDWTYDFNRRFTDFPRPGDAREEVLAWFADIEANLVTQLEIIGAGAE